MNKIQLSEYVKRFKNPGTILSLGLVVGTILIQFGCPVDMVWLETTLKLLCAAGFLVGVLNNPDTPGIDTPKK